jgi:HlyD family secretion protein
VLIALCAGAGYFAQSFAQNAAQTAAAANWKTEEVSTGPIDASVSATGNVETKAEANVSFSVDGNVTQIFVSEGQLVEEGQPLAQVDPADLQLSVERAQADLKQAQADYQKLVDGATPEQIAEAQAQIAQARGQYAQTAGSVTQADIAAAQAKLDAAKDRLARLQSGQSNTTFEQAQSNLEQARSQLASAKERARLSVETAANTLRNAQDTYTRTYWDNRRSEDQLAAIGQDLPQEAKDAEASAQRAVQDAELALEQAKIAYEEAKQQEVSTIQAREADVRAAQNTNTDNLADARAQVESAQAELNRLLGSNRSGSLEAARASVASAEAALAKLTAKANPSDLAVAEAGVARAEAALKQAQRSLEQATLRAPFAGTVTQINIRVGEPGASAGVSSGDSGGGAITIADMSSYLVDVPVDELDVAQLEPGQPARVTLDALPDSQIEGKIANIAPVATKNEQGTTNYEVTVDIQPGEARILPGMTASVAIVTEQKDNAILVPRRAIQTENGQTFVWVPTGGDQIDQATLRPASEQRPVKLGLSNAEYVEVLDGLKAGDTVLVAGTTSTFNPVGQ